jgi:hypothetical protein
MEPQASPPFGLQSLSRETIVGMFDYVVCEVPLPDDAQISEFQSKDLDCEMTTIRISAEGRLLVERYEVYDVPREKRPYPNAEPGSWQSICGIMGKRNRRWEDLNYHGDFNFYGDEQVGDPEPVLQGGKWSYARKRVWREYMARFSEGRLSRIWSVHDRDSDGTATAAANEDLPAPQDCQARAEGIAQGQDHD